MPAMNEEPNLLFNRATIYYHVRDPVMNFSWNSFGLTGLDFVILRPSSIFWSLERRLDELYT